MPKSNRLSSSHLQTIDTHLERAIHSFHKQPSTVILVRHVVTYNQTSEKSSWFYFSADAAKVEKEEPLVGEAVGSAVCNLTPSKAAFAVALDPDSNWGCRRITSSTIHRFVLLIGREEIIFTMSPTLHWSVSSCAWVQQWHRRDQNITLIKLPRLSWPRFHMETMNNPLFR